MRIFKWRNDCVRAYGLGFLLVFSTSSMKTDDGYLELPPSNSDRLLLLRQDRTLDRDVFQFVDRRGTIFWTWDSNVEEVAL